MSCFTSEFGMGSGGSNSLLPPGKLFGIAFTRYSMFGLIELALDIIGYPNNVQNVWALYGQASRAISTG